MDPFKKKMIMLGGLLVVVVLGIVVYRLTLGKGAPSGDCNVAAPKRVELTWWGDLEPAAAQTLINTYTATRPYVTITYTQLDPKQTEQQLINAWARNAGPDIFSVKNEQLRHFAGTGLVSAMPATTSTYTYTNKKVLGIKNQLQICKQDRPAPTPQLLQNTFVAGAVTDIYENGKIVGFPLQFDSLAMLYNQQLLDEAGVLTPPQTWVDMVKVVPKLTLLDDHGEVVRAGAALGRSTNVPAMPEFLTAMLKQYGITLTGADATFGSSKATQDVVNLAASFGNAAKQTYTWNDTFPDALDALAQGKVAIAFGTHADLAQVQSQTSGADIRVAAFPQAAANGTVTVADYWMQTVATKAADPNVAWDFLRTIADATQVQALLNVTGGTPAIRSLVQAAVNDPATVGTPAAIFAGQAANATGWFTGIDPTKAREALGTLVDDVATQKGAITDAIDRAQRLYLLALTASS